MKVKFLAICLVCIGFIACEKENPDQIPNVPVEFTINVFEPQFANLSGVGGWVYTTGGSRGIILFRRDIDKFAAYDRHTPLNPSESCAVLDVDSTSTYAIDRCSQSRFLLFDGSIVSGSAKNPLRSYNTTFNGSFLRVYN